LGYRIASSRRLLSPAEVTGQIQVPRRRFGINTLLSGVHCVGTPASLAMKQVRLIANQIVPAGRSAE
jgi:hypothetical protein